MTAPPTTSGTTSDSRFHRHRSHAGEIALYDMYARNLTVEGDGLAYPEQNLLRTVVLHPLFMVILGCNLLLEYNALSFHPWVLFAHAVGLIANALRLLLSCLILLFEVAIFVPRLLLSTLLTPIAFSLCLGHVYALPCAVWHAVLGGSGGVVLRVAHISKRFDPDMSVFERNAGGLGRVLCFRMSSAQHASYIAAVFNVRQRAGFGPEALWVRGQSVFVSDWTPICMSALREKYWSRWRGTHVWASWKLVDLKTMEWRRIIVTADMDYTNYKADPEPRIRPQCFGRSNVSDGNDRREERKKLSPGSAKVDNDEIQPSMDIELGEGNTIAPLDCNKLRCSVTDANVMSTADAEAQMIICGGQEAVSKAFGPLCRKLASILSMEHIGAMSSLAELEALYHSPLGWNKHHLMTSCEDQIQVTRRDRRLFGHVLAILSSAVTYIQFRDASVHRWFNLSIDLYGLLAANYAFITAYAAEVITGPVNEIVDAKSARYGVMATRAIDRGFVRGFHVPNGDWLLYENGPDYLPWHHITRCEINLTCNSVVRDTEAGPRIRVIGYEALQGQLVRDEYRGYNYEERVWAGG